MDLADGVLLETGEPEAETAPEADEPPADALEADFAFGDSTNYLDARVGGYREAHKVDTDGAFRKVINITQTLKIASGDALEVRFQNWNPTNGVTLNMGAAAVTDSSKRNHFSATLLTGAAFPVGHTG